MKATKYTTSSEHYLSLGQVLQAGNKFVFHDEEHKQTWTVYDERLILDFTGLIEWSIKNETWIKIIYQPHLVEHIYLIESGEIKFKAEPDYEIHHCRECGNMVYIEYDWYGNRASESHCSVCNTPVNLIQHHV
jgi:hypothetical protein